MSNPPVPVSTVLIETYSIDVESTPQTEVVQVKKTTTDNQSSVYDIQVSQPWSASIYLKSVQDVESAIAVLQYVRNNLM